MSTLTAKIKKLFNPIDFTQGTPWKNIINFSIPLLITFILSNAYTISDAAIVGYTLSPAEVSGVNTVYSLVYIVLQFAFGCASGFSVVSGHRMGEKNISGVRKAFASHFLLSLIIGVILTVLAITLMPYLLQLVNLVPEDASYAYAHDYLMVIYAGLAAQIFYNFIVSFLRSIGDSVTPLIFLFGSSILNIGLDFLFIMAFDWGVIGAAAATVVSQSLAFIALFIYQFIKYPYFRFKPRDFKIPWRHVKWHLRLGLPQGFSLSLLAIGMIALQRGMVNVDIANGVNVFDARLAYGAATKLVNMLMIPAISVATGVLSFCAQCSGAKNVRLLNQGVKQGLVMMGITYLITLFGLLFAINGWYTYLVIGPENNNEKIRWYASIYLIIDLVFFFLTNFMFFAKGVLQGVGKILFPFLSGLAELVGRLFVCYGLVALVGQNDPGSDSVFVALSFADPIAQFTACVVLIIGLIYYAKKRKLDFLIIRENDEEKAEPVLNTSLNNDVNIDIPISNDEALNKNSSEPPN